MGDAGFDPTRAIRFELARGAVYANGNERVIVLGAAALDVLARVADETTLDDVGRAMGAPMGERAARRLGGEAGVSAAALEDVVAALGRELATSGLGALVLERWGRAMVLVVERPAITSEALLAAIVAGAVGAACGRPLTCAPLTRDATSVRFLVARGATARRVRMWLASGVAWGDVLARLHADAGGGA